MMPAKVAAHIDGNSTAADELRYEVREELAEYLHSLRQEAMHVVALRHASARFGSPGEPIAIDERDCLEAVRKDARRKQSGDASAYD
jgi:hypothetical protein